MEVKIAPKERRETIDNVGDFCLATSQKTITPNKLFLCRVCCELGYGYGTLCHFQQYFSYIVVLRVELSLVTWKVYVRYVHLWSVGYLSHTTCGIPFWRDGTAQRKSDVLFLYPDFPMETKKYTQTCTLLSTFHYLLMHWVITKWAIFIYAMVKPGYWSWWCLLCVRSTPGAELWWSLKQNSLHK